MREILLNSKAGVVMVLLAVLGLLFDFTAFFNLEGLLADIVNAVNTLLLVMGIRDIMLIEKQKFLDAIADWRSKSFWGTLLATLSPLFLSPDLLPGLSEGMVEFFRIIGHVMATLGIADAGRRGRFVKDGSVG